MHWLVWFALGWLAFNGLFVWGMWRLGAIDED